MKTASPVVLPAFNARSTLDAVDIVEPISTGEDPFYARACTCMYYIPNSQRNIWLIETDLMSCKVKVKFLFHLVC